MNRSDIHNLFVTRLNEKMKETRYSQKQICEYCGITEAAFSRCLSSEDRLPKSDVIANIANLLHTTSDYLLGNELKFGFEDLQRLLASSKDDLSLNQKRKLMSILEDETHKQNGE